MKPTICRCCGDAMPEGGGISEDNPNVCNSCAWLETDAQHAIDSVDLELQLDGPARFLDAEHSSGGHSPEVELSATVRQTDAFSAARAILSKGRQAAAGVSYTETTQVE